MSWFLKRKGADEVLVFRGVGLPTTYDASQGMMFDTKELAQAFVDKNGLYKFEPQEYKAPVNEEGPAPEPQEEVTTRFMGSRIEKNKK